MGNYIGINLFVWEIEGSVVFLCAFFGDVLYFVFILCTGYKITSWPNNLSFLSVFFVSVVDKYPCQCVLNLFFSPFHKAIFDPGTS